MHFRSFYDAVLRNIEDGGGPAASAQTDAHPVDAGADTPSTTSVDTPNTDQDNEPPPLEEQLSKIWDNAHTLRDESGRFKSRNPQTGDGAGDKPNTDEDDGPDAATDDLEGKTTSPQDDEDGTGPDAATEAMPRSWSKDKEPVWAALPKEAKALLHQREQDMTVALSRAGHAVKAYREAEPVIRGAEPFRQYLAQREQATGVKSEQLVHDILRFAHGFDTAPDNDAKLDLIAQIADTFGVDFTPWIGTDAAEAIRGRTFSDPRVDALMREVQDLRGARERERLQEMDNTLAHALDAFSKDKAYPHFAVVRNEMGRYLGTLDPNDDRPVEVMLKEAYENACLLNPKIRQQVIRQEAERIARAEQQQDQTKASAARKASAANVKSGVPSPSKRTMDQDIEAAADRLFR